MRASLALAVAAALTVSCSKWRPQVAGVDDSLASLTPPDTIRLFGGSIEALRKTPVYEKYLAQRDLPMLDRFRTESGLDPREDLKEFLIANNGNDTIALIRGDFKRSEIEGRLRSEGAQSSSYQGVTIWSHDELAAAFLDSTTAAAGSVRRVQEVIGLRGGKGGIPTKLRELISTLPPGCQLWAVLQGSPGNLPVPERSNLRNLEKALEGVETLTAGFDLRRGLKISARAAFETETDAEQIRAALKGLIGIGRLSVPGDQRELLRIYDGIDVQRDAAVVRIEADIPFASLDDALKLLEFRRPARGD